MGAEGLLKKKAGASAVFGAAVIAAGVVGNAAAFVVPIDYAALGSLVYVGIFLLTFLANATVIVPIPYVPIVIRAADASDVAVLVIAAAAAGSMLGEAVSFFVGRAGRQIVSGSRVYRALHRLAHRPVLSGAFLFALAAPPNPFFDVAGLAAGALGIPFGVFAVAVFFGRFVRFGVLAWLGIQGIRLLEL